LSAPRGIPVFVVVPPRTLLLDIAGPVEALRRANQESDGVRFDVRYVGPAPRVTTSVGLNLADIEALPDRLPDAAVVLLSGDAAEPLVAGAPVAPEPAGADDVIVRWLRAAIRPGHRLISICSGALLAGRAGLLDGHDCTTHHGCCTELAALAPSARVVENRLYVTDGERWTSAGITAGIDLALHLIAELAGPAVAVAVARFLVVYLRRAGSDPQLSPWLEGRNHLHPAVHRVQDAITAEPSRPWSLPDLARIARASPRHLSRLFNEHAGMSVTDYVNRLRVALAATLVSTTRWDMERVAEGAGFGSARQLRRAWARHHALPPSRTRLAVAVASPGDAGHPPVGATMTP
jgi:transcriptional regulator GlxA family with amidase domain